MLITALFIACLALVAFVVGVIVVARFDALELIVFIALVNDGDFTAVAFIFAAVVVLTIRQHSKEMLSKFYVSKHQRRLMLLIKISST